MDFIFDPVT